MITIISPAVSTIIVGLIIISMIHWGSESAWTFMRLFNSRHVRDLLVIFLISVWIIISLITEGIVFISRGSLDLTDIKNSWPPIGAALGVAAAAAAWAYRTAANRLGIVDLFSSEIVTICRIVSISGISPSYIDMYDKPPRRTPPFVSQENYMPVFEHNSKDLEVLEARVVNQVTQFYTYLKTLRDYLRMLSNIRQPARNHANEWRSTLLNVLYTLFLMLESARYAVEQLIEFEPEREEGLITILLSELILYGFLLEAYDPASTGNTPKPPDDKIKFDRLCLRMPNYRELFPKIKVNVNFHYSQLTRAQENMRSHYKKRELEKWCRAQVLLQEFEDRYSEVKRRYQKFTDVPEHRAWQRAPENT